jgi:plasmid stabilization system protein ParE
LAHAEWTQLAEIDLEEIAVFLAVEQSNLLAAKRFLQAIDRKCNLYAQNPEMGTRIPELGKQYRVFSYKRWAVIYQSVEHGIKVVGVVDATRDYPAWLAKLPK